MASKYGGRVTTVNTQSIGERTGAFDVRNISIKDLVENKDNEKLFSMREADLKRLSDDIKKNGVLDPVWVIDNNDGTYKIESGHRRVRAAKMAGLERVPAVVNRSVNEIKEREILVKSNLLTREITPVQLAKLIEYHEETVKLAHKDEPRFQVNETIMEEFGLTRPNLFIYKNLLKLDDELLIVIDEFKLPFRPFVDSKFYEQKESVQKEAALFIRENIDENGDLPKGFIEEAMNLAIYGGTKGEKKTPSVKKEKNEYVDEDIQKISNKLEKIYKNLNTSGQKVANAKETGELLNKIETYISDIRKYM